MSRTIDTPPRRFQLVRHVDHSGVSGTGIVAEGAVWSSGAVALHWPGHPRATSVWSSIDDVRIAHGHGGDTSIKFLDAETEPKRGLPKDDRGWPKFGGAAVPLPDKHDPRD